MAENNQELEVKFYIRDLPAVLSHLERIGAQLANPRVHEVNLRFDMPGGDLVRESRVLRLRQDTRARLTYKGPGVTFDGATLRQEIEVTVSDFTSAQSLLQALGFEIVWMYEKHRTTYMMEDVEILLDEMPFGDFIELEAADPADIRGTASTLRLDWDARIMQSYTAIFANLRRASQLSFRDLSFTNFKDLAVDMRTIDIYPADRS